MILFPPAKINLGLRVLYKRTDDYHEIDSCMLPIPFYDVLELLPSKEFTFRQTGLKVDGDPEHNLCVKAFRLMQSNYDVPPVYMHLRKEIPMGAGLGGGSSDAAYVLRGLRDLFLPELDSRELEGLAAQLGSDCPLFVSDGPKLAAGRGEKLYPVAVNLAEYYLKLINPGIHIGTAEAYQGIIFPTDPTPVKDVIVSPVVEWKDKLINDFEYTAFNRYPELAGIKDKLYKEGAIYAAMTGSGSTLFGIYSNQPSLTFDSDSYLEKIMRL